MIKKTVYFRTQEDLDKFNAIPNKAQWLQDKLEDTPNMITQLPKPQVILDDTEDEVLIVNKKNLKVPKHVNYLKKKK